MLKIRFKIIWILLLILSSFVQAQKNAGIVAYFKNGDRVFLLIADHLKKDKGWASFGGKPKPGETNQQTALREFHEETKNIFKNQGIFKELKDALKVEMEKFVCFFVEVNFVSALEIDNTEIKGKEFNERRSYVWIPLEEILRTLSETNVTNILDKKYLPQSSPRQNLYIPFAQVIIKAKKLGVLDSL